jgi:hypothetical protein
MPLFSCRLLWPMAGKTADPAASVAAGGLKLASALIQEFVGGEVYGGPGEGPWISLCVLFIDGLYKILYIL